MKIKFVNLKREFNLLEKKLTKDLVEVGNTGQYVNGKNLYEFERKIAKFLGVKYCVGVSSWTDGAILTFKALSLKKSDGTGFSCKLCCKEHSIGWCKWNYNLWQCDKLISNKTKVIMPVILWNTVVYLKKT